MTTANKTTKKQYFEMIMAIEGVSEDIKDFCRKEIAILEKKNANRKPSKNQTANEEIKTKILEVLEDSEPMTCTEIMNTFNGEYSLNKIVALMTQLAGPAKDENRDATKVYPVRRIPDGKKMTFALNTEGIEGQEKCGRWGSPPKTAN